MAHRFERDSPGRDLPSRSPLRQGPAAAGLVLSLATAAAAGCGGGPRGDVSADPAVPAFRGRVNLSIGEVAGEDAYLFTRISGIARDDGGRIFVADLQASEIRVFEPDGAFLFRIGREGEGPGELSGPCCLAFDGEGRLWVRDNGNARYSAFAPGRGDGGFVTSIPIRHGAMNLWAPVTFDRDGRLVDVGLLTDPDEVLPTTARFYRTLDGDVADTVAIANPPAEGIGLYTVDRPLEDGSARFYLWQPHGPRHLVAHGPDGAWAEATGSTYRIAWHRDGVPPITVEGPTGPGPALSEREREAAESGMRRDRERVGVRSLPFDVPDRKPPLRDLFFDVAGRLWVELNVEDGADREADVYADDGARVGRYIWPAEVRPSLPGWTGPSALLGVTVDSLGVQRVARVRFEPAAGGS